MSRHLVAYAFGIFCILSAPPFIGIPFPNSRASSYYATKNIWITNIAARWGINVTPKQAGYFGATVRIILGLAFISTRYRRPSCAAMGAVVGYGTVRAVKDAKPLMPQLGMLAAVATVAMLG